MKRVCNLLTLPSTCSWLRESTPNYFNTSSSVLVWHSVCGKYSPYSTIWTYMLLRVTCLDLLILLTLLGLLMFWFMSLSDTTSPCGNISMLSLMDLKRLVLPTENLLSRRWTSKRKIMTLANLKEKLPPNRRLLPRRKRPSSESLRERSRKMTLSRWLRNLTNLLKRKMKARMITIVI